MADLRLEGQELVETMQYIVVGIGNEKYGIDISYIDNIVRMQKITRVPKVQSYIKGVINLRGEIVPVMSIRKKMGLDEDVITDVSRIIILKLEEKGSIGVIVDEVREVITLNMAEVEKQASKDSNIDVLYHMFDSQAEAIEFVVTEDSLVTNTTLLELQLKDNLLVCFISRKGRVFIPTGQDSIHVGDTVMIVTSHAGLSDIEDILN